jgi:MYXO-CTERM domain-containing protein
MDSGADAGGGSGASGCGCATAGADTASWSAFPALALCAGALARRRRSKPRQGVTPPRGSTQRRCTSPRELRFGEDVSHVSVALARRSDTSKKGRHAIARGSNGARSGPKCGLRHVGHDRFPRRAGHRLRLERRRRGSRLGPIGCGVGIGRRKWLGLRQRRARRIPRGFRPSLFGDDALHRSGLQRVPCHQARVSRLHQDLQSGPRLPITSDHRLLHAAGSPGRRGQLHLARDDAFVTGWRSRNDRRDRRFPLGAEARQVRVAHRLAEARKVCPRSSRTRSWANVATWRTIRGRASSSPA